MSSIKHKRGEFILVVGSSPDSLALMEAILTNKGYRIELANSIKSALSLVEKAKPDLIVLDLMLSEMEDSQKKICHLRADNSLSLIPILLLTYDRSVCREQAITAGADELVYKPFNLDTFFASVDLLLKGKNERDGDNLREQPEDRVIDTPAEITLIFDVDEDDPLNQEQKDLEEIGYPTLEATFWYKILAQGYEVVNVLPESISIVDMKTFNRKKMRPETRKL